MHDAATHIGTSGWSYDHWRGSFYPDDLPSGEMLGLYARCFTSVEINTSFYRLPERATFKQWRDTVPSGFTFSVKASRYLSHMKKLKNAKTSARRFFARASTLGDTLGPVLFQLPPRWSFDELRLADFLASQPPENPLAFEFRDHSWFNARAFELLEKHNAALCIYDLAGFQSPLEITADFVYLRLHGPADAYRGSYSTRRLDTWAERLSSWSQRGLSVYCYFNNDEAGYAAENALRLRAMLDA
jgi:uncharacterized protein YecE (DUF72 family)